MLVHIHRILAAIVSIYNLHVIFYHKLHRNISRSSQRELAVLSV